MPDVATSHDRPSPELGEVGQSGRAQPSDPRVHRVARPRGRTTKIPHRSGSPMPPRSPHRGGSLVLASSRHLHVSLPAAMHRTEGHGRWSPDATSSERRVVCGSGCAVHCARPRRPGVDRRRDVRDITCRALSTNQIHRSRPICGGQDGPGAVRGMDSFDCAEL